MGGGEETQARPVIVDQAGVSFPDKGDNLYVSSADAEIADLLCEGVIEGLVSGQYTYEGNVNQTGYKSAVYTAYQATGIDENYDTDLGFLQSVYWNDVPVVDSNGFYNFTNINIEYVKGDPAGSLPELSSKLPAQETLDLSVLRTIGERLYGISTQGGSSPTEQTTSDKIVTDAAIDTVAKTYTILNKECSKIQVRIKVAGLFENIRGENAPKTYEDSKELKKGHVASTGYGDTKARAVEYWIYFKPLFDQRFISVASGEEGKEVQTKDIKWSSPRKEVIEGKIEQIYIRNTTIDLKSDYVYDPAFSGWTIKIIRITPESLTSYLRNPTYVDSIVEIYGTKLRHPYSSMVYSKFDAEFFTRIPARSYDTKLIKVQVPNNYDPIKKTYGRSNAITMLTGYPSSGSSGVLVKITTTLKAGQRVYFESGSILSVTGDTSPSDSTTIPAGTWIKKGDAYKNHEYPKTGETGATLQGYSEGTDDDNFWDGGFKQIENWPGENGSDPKGDAQITKEWTDNPAWGFYDLLTNPRYGLGDYIDTCQVDKWALYEIAQYCDVLVDDGYGGIEPRFTMNHIITSREEAYKVINDLSSIFRGIAYYSNGLIHPVQDAYKKPIYQFNNTNVVEGNFTYASSAKKTRHSVALIRYINRRDFYKPAVEYVEDEEAIKRYGIREIQTTALGATSRGQARRFGTWLLASEFEETETISFSVGQDGAYLKPGDIFQVYDQYRTPLKFGGRTNNVEKNAGVGDNLAAAPNTVSYTNQGLTFPAGQNGSVTGNSVTIDNAVSFDTDQVYKFSLLTPTYSYDATQISDMDSDDISQIRRPQIQNLYFLGGHTRTVTGTYHSDYQQGGSGICTQIYFHTGLELTDGSVIGTGNQLDFDNYVITGYTNNYIQGPKGDITESYSGGCFSGQNLIWSLEPNNPNNPKLISGNFSNYRAINISENDDNSTYNISALAYSTGKYSNVESRQSFVSPTYSKPIHWPYIEIGGTKKTKDAYSIIKGFPQELNQPEKPINGQDFQYPTVEIRFPEAGAKLTESAQGDNKEFSVDPLTTNPSKTTYLICHHAASPTEAGFGLAGLSLGNAATLFSATDTALYNVSNADFQKFTKDLLGNSREYFIVPGNYYDVNDPENFSQYIDATKRPSNKPQTLASYFFEALLQKDANHWFAVFALNNNVRSENAVIGLIPGTNYNDNATPPAGIRDNQLTKTEVFSQIKLVDVSDLTTQQLTPADALKLNRLESTEPTFTWQIGNATETFDDQNNQLYIPIPYNDYRITIREHKDGTVPSSHIFMELTGQSNPGAEGSFTFFKEFNDPNTIVSLGEYNTDPNIKWYDAQGEITTVLNETEWFRSETSGILLRNTPNDYPIREFDIVVEAHDSNGVTSAGGKNSVGHIWNNTIIPNAEEGYGSDQNGFDKFGAQLAVPSGITFGYAPSIPGRQGAKKQFLISEEAYVRQYPYLATAAVYSDGTLSLSFEPSIDAAGNRVAVTSSANGAENDLRDTFSDVAGIVYYYTTGDNTVVDQLNVKTAQVKYLPNNRAPIFELQTANVLAAKAIKVNGSDYTNLDLGFQGNARFDDGGAYQNWDYDGENPQVPAILEKWVDGDDPKHKYAHIHRNYYILPGNVNPGDIRIPFPKIGLGGVQNIRLTLAFFDNLSLSQHFTSDGRPKTKTINNPKTKDTNQEIPTIFGDNSMAFSTIPQHLFGDRQTWYEGTKNGELFTQKPGHPMLLMEQSVLAESERALHYRAWFDVTIDPGEGPWFTEFTKNLWCFESFYWNGNSLNFNADFDYRYKDVPLKDNGGWQSDNSSYDEALPIAYQKRAGNDLPHWWNSSTRDNANTRSPAVATYRGPHRPNMSSKVTKDNLHTQWGGEPKGGPQETATNKPYLESTDSQPNGRYGHGDAPPTYYSIGDADPVVTRKRLVHTTSSVLYPPKVKLKGFSQITVSDIKISPTHQFAESCYVTLTLEKPLDPAFYSVDVEFYQSNMSCPLVNLGSYETNINLRDLAPADFPIKSYVCEKTEDHVKFFLSPFYVGGNSGGGPAVTEGLQKEMEEGTFILHYISQQDEGGKKEKHSWDFIPPGVFEIEPFEPEDFRTGSQGDTRRDYWYITKVPRNGQGLGFSTKETVKKVGTWVAPHNKMGAHYWPQGPDHKGIFYKVSGATVSATHNDIPYESFPMEGGQSTGVRQGNISFPTTSTPGYTGSNSASASSVVRYLKTKFEKSTGDITDSQKLKRFNGGFNDGDENRPDGLEPRYYTTYPNFLGNIIRMKGGILYSEEVYGK